MQTRYRFAISIIEEDDVKCTRIFKKILTTKKDYILAYMDSLSLLNKRQIEVEQKEAEEQAQQVQKELF